MAPLILILLLPFFASQSQASDSFNDFSNNDNVEEAGIEPSRFQKFLAKFEQEQHIAKFEQEQQMKLEAEVEEEDQMVGESSPKVARQVPDEPLPQVFGHPLTLFN